MTQSHDTQPGPITEHPQTPAGGHVREREIAAEQEVVDLAYGELDRRLAEA